MPCDFLQPSADPLVLYPFSVTSELATERVFGCELRLSQRCRKEAARKRLGVTPHASVRRTLRLYFVAAFQHEGRVTSALPACLR